MLLSLTAVSQRHRRTWNGRRQPGHGDQRLRSIVTRCGFGPPRGNLAPPSFLSGCPAIRGGHRGDSLGPHRADLFW